jgi:hypothetical protein
VTRLLLGAMLMVVLALTACSSEQGSQAQDSGEEQETQAPPEKEPASPPPEELVPATGVLERPEITTYMYGTHAVTDEASGERYALQSEDVGLDGYIGRRVTIYGTPVPGYENGQVEGGPPLLNVTRIEPI